MRTTKAYSYSLKSRTLQVLIPFSLLPLALGACGKREAELDPAQVAAVQTVPQENQAPAPQAQPLPVPTSGVSSQGQPLNAAPAMSNPRNGILIGYTVAAATAAVSGSDRNASVRIGSPIYAVPHGTAGHLVTNGTRYRDATTGVIYTIQNDSVESFLVPLQGQSEICGNRIDDNANGSVDENCAAAPAPAPELGNLVNNSTTANPVDSSSVSVPSGTFVGFTARETSVLINGRSYTVRAGSPVTVLHESVAGHALSAGVEVESTTYGTFTVPARSTSRSIYVTPIQSAPELCGNRFDDNATGVIDEGC